MSTIITASCSVDDTIYPDTNVGQSENGVIVDTATWDDHRCDDNQHWKPSK